MTNENGGDPIQVHGLDLVASRRRDSPLLLSDAHFTVRAATMTAVIGRSGIGKSTLVRCLAGAVAPARGSVLVAGSQLWPRPRRRRSRQAGHESVGLMFQSANLVSSLSVRNNVALPSRLRPDPDWRVRTTEALATVGLAAHASRRPAELSGGEQQRVAIARLIASGPAVALIDEPTSSLDASTAEQITDALVQLAQRGTAVFVVTHDLDLASRADRTLVFTGGGLRDHTGDRVGALRRSLDTTAC